MSFLLLNFNLIYLIHIKIYLNNFYYSILKMLIQRHNTLISYHFQINFLYHLYKFISIYLSFNLNIQLYKIFNKFIKHKMAVMVILILNLTIKYGFDDLNESLHFQKSYLINELFHINCLLNLFILMIIQNMIIQFKILVIN